MSSKIRDRLIPLKQACALLGLTSETVRQLADKGVLPHERDSNDQRRFSFNGVMDEKERRDKAKKRAAREDRRRMDERS